METLIVQYRNIDADILKWIVQLNLSKLILNIPGEFAPLKKMQHRGQWMYWKASSTFPFCMCTAASQLLADMAEVVKKKGVILIRTLLLHTCELYNTSLSKMTLFRVLKDLLSNFLCHAILLHTCYLHLCFRWVSNFIYQHLQMLLKPGFLL